MTDLKVARFGFGCVLVQSEANSEDKYVLVSGGRTGYSAKGLWRLFLWRQNLRERISTWLNLGWLLHEIKLFCLQKKELHQRSCTTLTSQVRIRLLGKCTQAGLVTHSWHWPTLKVIGRLPFLRLEGSLTPLTALNVTCQALKSGIQKPKHGRWPTLSWMRPEPILVPWLSTEKWFVHKRPKSCIM